MVIVRTVNAKQFERELGSDQALEMVATTSKLYDENR